MLDKKIYDMPRGTDMAWCPGCGNFPILNIVKMALAELDIKPQDAVICSGIGQAAKTPQYMRVNYFNGLHGRALPPATAIKLANPGLVVISESGYRAFARSDICSTRLLGGHHPGQGDREGCHPAQRLRLGGCLSALCGLQQA